MYKRNIGLVTLELAFQGPPSLLAGIAGPGRASSRVITLYLILEQSLFQRSAFDDVKEYIGQLSFEDAKYFIENFSKTLLGKVSVSRAPGPCGPVLTFDQAPDEQRRLVVRTLEIKFRYLLTTCPLTLEHVVVVGEAEEPRLKCKFCSSLTDRTCKACLEHVVSTALSTYKDVEKAPETLKGLDKDPRSDLALVASSALLKLSGLRQAQIPSKLPPLSNVDMSRLLQAAAILGTQVTRTPNEIPLRLLLVQLYLLLGCASIAYQTWVPMDVKRTVQDALSPLFFDRISTISPGLFHQSRHPLLEPLTSYYTGCLRENSPVKIWDAFKAGSYTSILDMAAYSDRLRRSCTLAMTVIEERRATRASGGRLEGGIEQSRLLAHLTTTDDTTFVNATDHGSFPSLESTHTPPLYELVKLGPELSSVRCRLSLLSEQFIDAVTLKPPKEYKPTKANDIAVKDRSYLVETFARIHTALTTLLLQQPAAAEQQQQQKQLTTGAEHKFFTAVSLLAALLHTALATAKTDPTPSSLSTTVSGLRSTLVSLQTDLLAVPPQLAALASMDGNGDGDGDVLHCLTNPHTLSFVRETALATKHASSFLVSFHAAEQARDRSGKANLHKEVVAEAKGLEALATKMLAETKDKVRALKEALGQGGWLDRVEGWLFRDGDELGELVRDVVGTAECEEWAARVVESWREGVKGFGMVRWE